MWRQCKGSICTFQSFSPGQTLFIQSIFGENLKYLKKYDEPVVHSVYNIKPLLTEILWFISFYTDKSAHCFCIVCMIRGGEYFLSKIILHSNFVHNFLRIKLNHESQNCDSNWIVTGVYHYIPSIKVFIQGAHFEFILCVLLEQLDIHHQSRNNLYK